MYFDLTGREFTKKPIELGALVRVCKGYFDTLNDEEVGKSQLAIVVNVERFMEDDNKGSYNLMPCYDLLYVDENGKRLNIENRVPYNVVNRSGLKLNSKKYAALKATVDKVLNKLKA